MTFDDAEIDAPDVRETRRRNLGWHRPEGDRYQCACGWSSESGLAAADHVRANARLPATIDHTVRDGRDGARVEAARR